MILIFDLDDTLYPECSFVNGGLDAVARFGEAKWGLNAGESSAVLRDILSQDGRGKIFDRWLQENGCWSRGGVKACVKVYRYHAPRLELFPSAVRVIDRYAGKIPLYIVTDGHKIVQRNKVDALNLWDSFRRIFITHRFGITAAKPSTLCFERIKDAEKCDWSDMVYVGDNPSKDFVGLNALGTLTVRVLTGTHASTQAKPSYDAIYTIHDLDELPEVL